MKKLISLFVLLAMAIPVIAWNPSISIDSTEYKPSPFESEFGEYSTGSQIIAKITVSNPDGSNETKRTQLEWDSSSVGCVRKEKDAISIHYECTITVTPTMNQVTEVYIKTYSKTNQVYSTLLGTYPFNGKPFPTNPQATASSNKINFRGRNADYLEILNNEKGISKLIFNFVLNEQTGIRPVSTARGAMSITTTDKDKLSFNLKKYDELIETEGMTTLIYKNVPINYKERTQTCKIVRGRERCKTSYNRPSIIEDVTVEIDFNNKEINILSNSLEVSGISGKIVECRKDNGRTYCFSNDW